MIQKHKEKENEGSSLDKLKEKFEQIKTETQEIQHIDTSDRQVMLRIKAESCGCGGSEEYVDIMRVVPYDSPLNDGDIVDTYKEADEIW